MSRLVYVGCKITPELKERFQDVCWKARKRPSKVLREMIKEKIESEG